MTDKPIPPIDPREPILTTDPKSILTVGPRPEGPVVIDPAQAKAQTARLRRSDLFLRQPQYWPEADKKNYSFLFFLSGTWLITTLLTVGSLLALAAVLPETTHTRIFKVFCVLVFATGLYCFRCRALNWYGALEIGVGVVTAGYVIFKYEHQADDASLAALVSGLAALYIIVRGYDNLYKGIEKNPEHARVVRLWKKLFFGEDQTAAG